MSKSPAQEYREKVKTGDLKGMSKLVKDHPEVTSDSKDRLLNAIVDGLAVACEKGDLKAVRFLVEEAGKGANITFDEIKGKMGGEAKEAEVKVGNDIQKETRYGGFAALRGAAKSGHSNIIEYFQSKDPNILQTKMNPASNIAFAPCVTLGDKLLAEAAANNQFKCVKSLQKLGVNIGSPNSEVLTQVMENGTLQDKTLPKVFKEGADVNARGGMAVAAAAVKRDWATVNTLITEYNADLSLPEAGATLVQATKKNDLAQLKYFLQRGADIDVAGGTVITKAAEWGLVDIVRTALNPQMQTVDGKQVKAATVGLGEAMDRAAPDSEFERKPEDVKEILDLLSEKEYGFKISEDPVRAIHTALERGHNNLAKRVWDENKDKFTAQQLNEPYQIEGGTKHTLLQRAVMHGNVKISEPLLSHKDFDATQLQDNDKKITKDMADSVVTRKDMGDGRWLVTEESVLVSALGSGKTKTATLLLESGADVNKAASYSYGEEIGTGRKGEKVQDHTAITAAITGTVPFPPGSGPEFTKTMLEKYQFSQETLDFQKESKTGAITTHGVTAVTKAALLMDKDPRWSGVVEELTRQGANLELKGTYPGEADTINVADTVKVLEAKKTSAERTLDDAQKKVAVPQEQKDIESEFRTHLQNAHKAIDEDPSIPRKQKQAAKDEYTRQLQEVRDDIAQVRQDLVELRGMRQEQYEKQRDNLSKMKDLTELEVLEKIQSGEIGGMETGKVKDLSGVADLQKRQRLEKVQNLPIGIQDLVHDLYDTPVEKEARKQEKDMIAKINEAHAKTQELVSKLPKQETNVDFARGNFKKQKPLTEKQKSDLSEAVKQERNIVKNYTEQMVNRLDDPNRVATTLQEIPQEITKLTTAISTAKDLVGVEGRTGRLAQIAKERELSPELVEKCKQELQKHDAFKQPVGEQRKHDIPRAYERVEEVAKEMAKAVEKSGLKGEFQEALIQRAAERIAENKEVGKRVVEPFVSKKDQSESTILVPTWKDRVNTRVEYAAKAIGEVTKTVSEHLEANKGVEGKDLLKDAKEHKNPEHNRQTRLIEEMVKDIMAQDVSTKTLTKDNTFVGKVVEQLTDKLLHDDFIGKSPQDNTVFYRSEKGHLHRTENFRDVLRDEVKITVGSVQFDREQQREHRKFGPKNLRDSLAEEKNTEVLEPAVLRQSSELVDEKKEVVEPAKKPVLQPTIDETLNRSLTNFQESVEGRDAPSEERKVDARATVVQEEKSFVERVGRPKGGIKRDVGYNALRGGKIVGNSEEGIKETQTSFTDAVRERTHTLERHPSLKNLLNRERGESVSGLKAKFEENSTTPKKPDAARSGQNPQQKKSGWEME